MEEQPLPRPFVFGEVLFDCFPDGAQVLGGAPFNVAWHLQGLGLAPLLISRVGTDEQGQQVLAAMEKWDMDCSAIQQDPIHPTGKVEVTLQGGQPSFNILPNQAYDFIDPASLLKVLSGEAPPLLYRGTLAVRSSTSRSALETLSKIGNPPVFLDLNLRSPWWQRDSMEQALHTARWAKLNDAELFTLLEERAENQEELVKLAQSVCHRFQLEWLLVTLGEKGALLVTADNQSHWAEANSVKVVDTVGAGDAFSAVMIQALLQDWPLKQALERGVDFAATVCTMQGAVTQDPQFYARAMASWQEI
ncbi:PfkB domain protein [Nitrosococcus halophilus Nc 4]|uniref:PfkB domain protein n=1 Tax=Nitrosococcus halophilus (strain Nc4) TaxID=472759 RepID=D5C415_NITHN|nr:carbohydrate kinase [Nitrosococcus halophilus]ADE16952.1 PfkB domain protein [Nitrosococcus halophilus Nc 4]